MVESEIEIHVRDVLQYSRMTPRDRVITFRPDLEDIDAMRALKERDGIPLSEQLRRALKMWLDGKGVKKAPRQRADTRRRG